MHASEIRGFPKGVSPSVDTVGEISKNYVALLGLLFVEKKSSNDFFGGANEKFRLAIENPQNVPLFILLYCVLRCFWGHSGGSKLVPQKQESLRSKPLTKYQPLGLRSS